MEFVKKHWWKIVLGVIVFWFVWRYIKNRPMVTKEAGSPNPGDHTGGAGGANQ